jgi:hypothetical protein
MEEKKFYNQLSRLSCVEYDRFAHRILDTAACDGGDMSAQIAMWLSEVVNSWWTGKSKSFESIPQNQE